MSSANANASTSASTSTIYKSWQFNFHSVPCECFLWKRPKGYTATILFDENDISYTLCCGLSYNDENIFIDYALRSYLSLNPTDKTYGTINLETCAIEFTEDQMLLFAKKYTKDIMEYLSDIYVDQGKDTLYNVEHDFRNRYNLDYEKGGLSDASYTDYVEFEVERFIVYSRVYRF